MGRIAMYNWRRGERREDVNLLVDDRDVLFDILGIHQQGGYHSYEVLVVVELLAGEILAKNVGH